jgi:hypothetical protein
VPDVLLSAIGLQRGARVGLVAALWAALGAGAGGALMYLWSVHDPAGAESAVLAVPAVSAPMLETARAAMAGEGWFAATLAGPLSFTPYKVYAILAPQAGAGLAAFVAASILARLPRFLAASLGAALLSRLAPRIPLRWLNWALGGAWAAFYAAFFALTPG